MRDLSNDPVLKFAIAMSGKLSANSDKSGWWNEDNGYLFRRLGQEIAELRRAIKKNKSKEDIIGEAADVANFAMMIADNYEQEEEK